MKVFAIVPSAGSGARMGPGRDDKPFLEINGKPLLFYALSCLEKSAIVEGVVLVIKNKYAAQAEALIAEYGMKKVKHIVSGGDTRAGSVKNGLEAIDASDEDIIVIHDGARPFLTEEVIRAVVETAERHGAAVAGMPLTSTIKKVDDRTFIEDTTDRKRLWEAQTPQAFRYDVIKRAYLQPGVTDATDDAYLVERTGCKVKMVEGGRRNIKVTVPEDIALAEALFRI